jgi:sphingolipid 4-desaturase/C4-monooxygenase
MGQHVSMHDFEWVYTDEPHATRRKQILERYPKVRELMGHDPMLKWTVLGLVSFQVLSLFVLQYCTWPVCLLMAYCVGGVINHSLSLANHEISHNLAFGHGRPLANRFLGMIANLPLIVPMSVSFKKYHLLHHRYQGNEVLDMDLPSQFEGQFFANSFTKFIWLLLQPFFYCLRPVILLPLPMSFLEIVNICTQVLFVGSILFAFGWWAIAYLLGGLLLSMGVHPVAGHFISEHYVFQKGFETYSYYGILNKITFNVGYHNEHHDFPSIPGSRLPLLKAMAPEFYDTLPSHTSWVKVLYDFVLDPDVGPFSRVKRPDTQQSKLLKEGVGCSEKPTEMNGVKKE